MRIVIEIPVQGQWCDGCQFNKGVGLFCQLFHQERIALGEKRQRLIVCMSAEEAAENL